MSSKEEQLDSVQMKCKKNPKEKNPEISSFMQSLGIDSTPKIDPDYTLEKGYSYGNNVICLKNGSKRIEKSEFNKRLDTLHKIQDKLRISKGADFWKDQVDGFGWKKDLGGFCSTDPNTIVEAVKALQDENGVEIQNNVNECDMINGMPKHFRKIEIRPTSENSGVQVNSQIPSKPVLESKPTQIQQDKEQTVIEGIIDNNSTELFIPLEGLSDEFQSKINRAIYNDSTKEESERMVTYFTRKYDQKDGRYYDEKHLLLESCSKNGKYGLCSTIGLADNIKHMLKEANIDFEVNDKRQLPPAHKFKLKSTIKVDGKDVPLSLRDYQQEIVDEAVKKGHGIVEIATGGGKAQPLDAKILTLDGWKLMGEIESGDEIIGIDGLPHFVLDVYPQGIKDVYRVTFQDGSFTECCKEHLWNVQQRYEKYRGKKYKTMSVEEILKEGLFDKSGCRKWQIPITKPIRFKQQNLPIHPYVLGCLLGDGGLTLNIIKFSNNDISILNQIELLLPSPTILIQLSNYDYDIRIQKENSGVFGCNPVLNAIRDLNLQVYSHEKFIPDIYKFCSIKQRIAILQGLLDTDGSARSDHSGIEYSTSSEQLADDVIFIVNSLGGKAIKHSRIPKYTYKGEKKEGLRSYRISINLGSEIIPFRSERKLSIYKKPSKYLSTRIIDSIELIGQKECQCIYTDAPDHLYLTDFCIATHNTVVGTAIIGEIGQDTAFVVPNNSLFYNAKTQIESYIDPDKVNIGQVGGMNVDVKNDPNKVDINIVSLPLASLAISNPERINPDKKQAVLDVLNQSQTIIFDECLVGNTNIITNEGELKQIIDINNNDNIIGGTVSNKFEKEVKKTIIIETSFNSIETTETHPNFIIDHLEIDRSHKRYGKYNNPTEKDIKIIKSNELQIGNYLLVIDKLPHIQKTHFTEDELYFVAVIMCDGHLDKKGYRTKLDLRIREKLNDSTKLNSEFYQKVLNIVDKNEKVTVSITHRNNIPYSNVIYSNSKKLRNYLIDNFNIPIGKKSELIDINHNIFSANINSIKAFIQGCFDCEGWVQKGRVGFSSASKQFIDKLQLLLLKFGILAHIRVKTLNKLKNTSLYQLDITGDNLIRFNSEIGFRCEYKVEKLKQMIEKIPNRTLSHYVIYNSQKYFLYKIKNIYIKEIENIVYDFTTTSHSFIANGFLTHNCHHISADTYKKVAGYSPSKYRFGLSATPHRDDGKTLEIVAGVGGTLGRKIKAKELIAKGKLTPPIIYFVDNRDITPKSRSEILKNLEDESCKINEATKMHKNVKELKRLPAEYDPSYYRYIEKGSIECNNPRNERIVDLTEKLDEYDKTKVIFVNSVEHGKKLQDMMEKKGIYSEILTGDTESRILKKLEEGEEQLNEEELKKAEEELQKGEEKEKEYNKKRNILFDKMKAGELKTIIATDKIMGEGVDIPAIDTIILSNMRKSKTNSIQTVGRALRKKEGKKKAIIIDFDDHKPYLDDWKDERKYVWGKEEFQMENISYDSVDRKFEEILEGKPTSNNQKRKELDKQIIMKKKQQREYEDMNLPELKQLAKSKGIKITGLKKIDILTKLMQD